LKLDSESFVTVVNSCDIDGSLTPITASNIAEIDSAAIDLEDVVVRVGSELVSRDGDDDVPSLDSVKIEAVEETLVGSETPFDS
jgi:hypothetical protein